MNELLTTIRKSSPEAFGILLGLCMCTCVFCMSCGEAIDSPAGEPWRFEEDWSARAIDMSIEDAQREEPSVPRCTPTQWEDLVEQWYEDCDGVQRWASAIVRRGCGRYQLRMALVPDPKKDGTGEATHVEVTTHIENVCDRVQTFFWSTPFNSEDALNFYDENFYDEDEHRAPLPIVQAWNEEQQLIGLWGCDDDMTDLLEMPIWRATPEPGNVHQELIATDSVGTYTHHIAVRRLQGPFYAINANGSTAGLGKGSNLPTSLTIYWPRLTAEDVLYDPHTVYDHSSLCEINNYTGAFSKPHPVEITSFPTSHAAFAWP